MKYKTLFDVARAGLTIIIAVFLLAPGAWPQSKAKTLAHFQHILLIVQENRTPDNLFGSHGPSLACGIGNPFEAGVDIQNGGPNKATGQTTCLKSASLNVCWDPLHSNQAWNDMADIQNGVPRMDGACSVQARNYNCTKLLCPQYTYVQKSDVRPYFELARNYGFANYMFQTNEGPSLPAHQFLLSGTSAPVPPGDTNNYYQDFVSGNTPHFYDSGCPDLTGEPAWVRPDGTRMPGSPDCYDHQTLVDLLNAKSVSWRYYTPKPGVIWTAINAIAHLCYTPGTPHGQPCDTADWNNSVIWPSKFGGPASSLPVIDDIQNCKLQAMNWVMPDEKWSDHPSFTKGPVTGPSYVADIVDAIGESQCQDPNGQTYWQSTAIFITWDDWGGFYDHVAPPAIYRGQSNPPACTVQNAPNGWGCGYTYGFRVPLLVVSAYTPAGYVSGALPPYGKGEVFPYVHDFGSILAFVEHNFGLATIAPLPYSYADVNALDNKNGNIPLSDFFPISPRSPRSFVRIAPTAGYDANYFLNYYSTHGVQPQGPDEEEDDD